MERDTALEDIVNETKPAFAKALAMVEGYFESIGQALPQTTTQFGSYTANNAKQEHAALHLQGKIHGPKAAEFGKQASKSGKWEGYLDPKVPK